MPQNESHSPKIAPLHADDLEQFEFELHGSASRPAFWLRNKYVSETRDQTHNELLLLADVLVRAKKFRESRVEPGDRVTSESLARILGARKEHVEAVLSKGRVPNSWATMEAALEVLLLGSNRHTEDPRARQVYIRIRNVFFGPPISRNKGEPSSPFFAKEVKDVQRPVNYWEALTQYYRYRGLLAQNPNRRRVSLTLVSGHHPFTAGERDVDDATLNHAGRRERERALLVKAFCQAQIDCARSGCTVTVLVPDTKSSVAGVQFSDESPAVRSAKRLRERVNRMAPDVLVNGTFRFLALDPCEYEQTPSGGRFAAEYLQSAFRYASFLAEEKNEDSPGGWDVYSQDVLVLRPLAESHLLLGSFDASPGEVESFNEWMQVFGRKTLPLLQDPQPSPGRPARRPAKKKE